MVTKSIPSEFPTTPLPLAEAVTLLTTYLHDYNTRVDTEFDSGILTALFVLRLLLRGDLTYEPLS